jgi:hypothetical protein
MTPRLNAKDQSFQTPPQNCKSDDNLEDLASSQPVINLKKISNDNDFTQIVAQQTLGFTSLNTAEDTFGASKTKIIKSFPSPAKQRQSSCKNRSRILDEDLKLHVKSRSRI